jgi:Na+/melibiose symporter-like transporter
MPDGESSLTSPATIAGIAAPKTDEAMVARARTTDASLREMVAWGTGGFAENLANSAILSLIYPIFNVALGFSPMAIGTALAVSRIVDAVVDPVMGNFTDNVRTPWGRRRPFIFAGAILMAMFFGLIWWLPAWLPTLGARTAENALEVPFLISLGIETIPALKMFLALTVVCLLFYFSFTVFVIPFSGLGIELVQDYAARTNIQVYRLWASFLASLMVGWLYLWSQNIGIRLGGNEVLGVRYVGLAVAALILLTAILPALFCRERFSHSAVGKKIRLLAAVKLTLTHKPFLMLMGSVFAVFIGLFFAIPLMTYIGIYHCCGGDKKLAAEIGGVMTTIQTVGQFAAMPLIAWANKHFEKRTILFAGIGMSIVGYISTWWLFTPAYPWLQIVPYVIAAWGLCSCWAVNGSFAADICDDDELRSGHRREGLYSAVFAFVYKSAIGLVALGTALLLAWVGIKGGDAVPSAEAITRVRFAYMTIPAVCLTMAIVAMWRYPLSRARVMEIQTQLKSRREHVELAKRG